MIFKYNHLTPRIKEYKSKMKTDNKNVNVISVSKTTNNISDGFKNNDFSIVGIGASAGGLETLEKFLAKMPTNTGMAFRYRSLFESAKDGILVLDAENGNIMEINSYLIDMLGYAKDKLIDKAIWEVGFFKNIIHNKDKFLKLQQTKFIQYEDLPLETGDGRKINIEFISNVFSVENNKVIQCFIREISDKKVEKSLIPHNRKN